MIATQPSGVWRGQRQGDKGMTDVFDGRSISGDINHYTEGLKEQDDPQLFLDALDELLAVPGVIAVRWRQYTPYFNDGDPCVFSIYGAEVAVEGDKAETYYENDLGYEFETNQQIFRDVYDLYDYDQPGYTYENRPLKKIAGVDTMQLQKALKKFEEVLESGTHYVVLQQKFGDPAEVTANKDGFHVEFYEHD